MNVTSVQLKEQRKKEYKRQLEINCHMTLSACNKILAFNIELCNFNQCKISFYQTPLDE